jgi:uncharacterized protein YcnI
MKKFFIALLSLAVVVPALAHATVRTEMNLSESKVGASETYRLRVPTEKPMATTEVRMVVPEGLTISTFQTQSGFTRTAQKNAQGVITEVTWRGNIDVDEYGLFVFRAKNPAAPTTLRFKVFQKYADGSVVAWDNDSKDAERPASQVEIK